MLPASITNNRFGKLGESDRPSAPRMAVLTGRDVHALSEPRRFDGAATH
jgi:hypothetical protein